MRNLHVIASVDPVGGGPVEALKQVGAILTSQGHTVEVACMDAPESPWLQGFPLTVHALGPGRTALGYAPKMDAWLRANMDRFDAVIVDGLWMYNGYAVWKASKHSNTPYFVFTHGMLDPWFNKEYPLKRLKKALYWPWGQYPVLRDAAAVLFTCEEEKLLARESFRPYKVNEVVVKFGTSGPVKEKSEYVASFASKVKELSGKRFLLYLSRIHEKKGCDNLIRAFAHLAKKDSEILLAFVGPDPTNWIPELKGIAESLGISDRVLWPGMLTGDDKWGAFMAAEAFVLPSHQENFGIVVAEALASGTPVLISNKVNIWREIQAAGAGIVEDDTLEGTVRLLESWSKLTDLERRDMAEKAKSCFLQNFEIKAAVESLLQVTRHGRDIP